MEREQDIDEILKQWPFDPQSVNVRLLESAQRRVLQMRVDMGILQLETDG
ncbi:MAG: DNA helicase UvrBC, partial [Planctomycetaceae bacterium]|nr:DNA helicase UvrBC [Planctomycetaceae bacterium]